MTTLFGPAVFSQNSSVNTVDSLAGEFVKSIRNNDREKVILQTDRNVYIAGEKIWYKAFLLHALNNRIDTMSKNLFVDLVDDDDKVINQQVLNTLNLRTDGAIQLNDSLPTGYYWLRGYTENILRTDSNAINVRLLYIKNVNNTNVLDISGRQQGRAGSLQSVIHFYPEGGSSITGINSTGALQVSDAAGNPVTVQGTVKDDHDSLIINFITNKFGLARISFYPVWFKKYFAVMNINGKAIKYPLPGWNPFAAQISVTSQSAEYIQADVALEDSIYSRKFTTYVLGVSRDSVCFAGVGKGMYRVNIPVANFPGGIATLLLFDANSHLLSERKVFINKDNYSIQVVPGKTNYTAREKAHVDIDVTDADGKPMVAALSIAVQDNRLMQMSDDINPGTIPPVAQYEMGDWLKLNKNNISADDIDLIMLAQKPEFNNWQAGNETGKRVADNTELLRNLEGTVVNHKQQPLKQKVVTAISLTGLNPYIGLDTTNYMGAFQLPLPMNRDSLLLKVEVKNRRDRNEDDDIVINKFRFPHFATPVSLKRVYAAKKEGFARQITRYHLDTVFIGVGKEWLKPVIVKAYVKPKILTQYDESKRVSSFSYVLNQEKLRQYGAGSIGNALLMIPGITYKQGQLVLFGGQGWMDSTSKSEPLLVIDGIRMSKSAVEAGGTSMLLEQSPVMSYLNAFSYQDIDFIEVLRGPEASIYGVEGGNGVILVNTKTHHVDESIPAASKIVQPVTYNTAPKFIMPDYLLRQVRNSKSPDPRTTIYWNGSVLTGTNGKASVDFFTADDATTYSVIVSGLTGNGEYICKRVILNRK